MRSHLLGFVSVAAALALVSGVLSGAVAASATEASEGSGTEVSDASSASTEAEARVIADTYDHDVIVDSETNATLLVKALATGGFSSEADAVPARVKQNGQWVEEDTTLQATSSDWVMPVAAAAPVQFSRGGTDELAKVRSADGSWLTESWPYGTLPTPSVEDSTVTYANVLPDVDLKLSATEVGMSEVVVVKSAEAAANPTLKSLEFSLNGATAAVQTSTKTVTATTPSGSVIGSGTPLWWDSSADGAAFDTPGGSEAKALTYSTTADTVALNVQAATSTPGVQYPVYIDPDWATNNAYLMADWYDDRAYPNQSYLDPPEDSVGYGISGGIGYLSRAFFKFNTSNLAGKNINSSHMGLYQTYANSCDTTLVQAWRYDTTAQGFTWNTEPAAWAQELDQQGDANGGPCAPNPGNVGWNVGAGTVFAAAHSLPSMTIGLRVANESNSLTRKHYRWDATLVSLYDTPPSQPANLKFTFASSGGTKLCGTHDNPTILRIAPDAPVTFSATITDADMPTTSQNLHGVFYVNDMQGTTAVAVASYTSANAASGSTFKWNYTPAANALKDGDLYKWYVVSTDGLIVGPHSTDCYFRDYFAPVNAVATVTFPQATTSYTPTVGDAAPVTISVASADARVVGFLYWTKASSIDPGLSPVGSLASFDSNISHVCGSQTQTVNPDGTIWGYACRTGGTVTVPAIDSTMSMGVIPFDAAGNSGDDTMISTGSGTFASNRLLTYNPDGSDPNSSAHTWQTDSATSDYDPSEPMPTNFSDTNTTAAVSLVPGSGVTGAADSTPLGSNPYVLSFDGVNGQTPTLTDPVRVGAGTTAGPLTVSVWAKPADTTGNYTALSQRGPNQPYEFTVQIDAGHPSICFRSQVAGSSTRGCAIDTADTLSPTSWTLITGIWDAANNQVRLLLNDKINAVATQVFTDDAGDPGVVAPIALGCDVDSAGKTSNTFKGELADPAVFPGVISGAQLKAIYQLKTNL